MPPFFLVASSSSIWHDAFRQRDQRRPGNGAGCLVSCLFENRISGRQGEAEHKMVLLGFVVFAGMVWHNAVRPRRQMQSADDRCLSRNFCRGTALLLVARREPTAQCSFPAGRTPTPLNPPAAAKIGRGRSAGHEGKSPFPPQNPTPPGFPGVPRGFFPPHL